MKSLTLVVIAACLAVALATLNDAQLAPNAVQPQQQQQRAQAQSQPQPQQQMSQKTAKGFVSRLPRSATAGPSGLAFAQDGLYVVDESNSCVYRFDSKSGGVASQALTC